MNLRTTVLTLAVVGFLATAFAAPIASAEEEVPSKHPGECMQVYLFYAEVGPVALDGSDSCVSATVHEDDCDPEETDLTQAVPDDEDCREDIEDFLENPPVTKSKFPPTFCVYPFGCT